MKNETDITVILDRSGSMTSCREATITGFNTFLTEQRKLPDPAKLTVTQFDTEYEMVYAGREIGQAPELAAETFVPRGNTALLDAIGRTIVAIGARLSSLQEDDRPNKVIVVILTDGQENASKEFDRAKIFEMISHQRQQYAWEFVFLGANQDAIAAGQSLGIANSANYSATPVGTHDAFTTVSRGIGSYRSGGGYQP